MKYRPRKMGCCEADRTWVSGMTRVPVRGMRRAMRVVHRLGDKVFWHWSDQRVEPTP